MLLMLKSLNQFPMENKHNVDILIYYIKKIATLGFIFDRNRSTVTFYYYSKVDKNLQYNSAEVQPVSHKSIL